MNTNVNHTRINSVEYVIVDPVKIGQRIQSLRKENHMRVTDISEQLGLTGPQAVYKWMSGKCIPEMGNMIMLSRMFHTTVEELVLGESVS